MTTSTIYDDVFRTLLNDCPELVIPLINVMVGRNEKEVVSGYVVLDSRVRKGYRFPVL